MIDPRRKKLLPWEKSKYGVQVMRYMWERKNLLDESVIYLRGDVERRGDSHLSYSWQIQWSVVEILQIDLQAAMSGATLKSEPITYFANLEECQENADSVIQKLGFVLVNSSVLFLK